MARALMLFCFIVGLRCASFKVTVFKRVKQNNGLFYGRVEQYLTADVDIQKLNEAFEKMLTTLDPNTYEKSQSSDAAEQFVATANLHLLAAYVGGDPTTYIERAVNIQNLNTWHYSEAVLDEVKIQFLYRANEVMEIKIPFSTGAFLIEHQGKKDPDSTLTLNSSEKNFVYATGRDKNATIQILKAFGVSIPDTFLRRRVLIV